MACSPGTVTHGAGTIDINTCVSTTSTNVNVSLEGTKGETWPFQGYVKLTLKRADTNSEVWYDVSTKEIGYWANSTAAAKHYTFNNIGYKGSVMSVWARFYTDSSYKTQLNSLASHMFIR